jgi:hypothetical protein
MTVTKREFRELMRRRNGGLEVALRWHPETDSVSIEVVDDQTGETHEAEVPRDSALDAFEHPYAFLARAA